MPELSRFFGIIIRMMYQDEKAWNEAVSGRPFDRIKPLS